MAFVDYEQQFLQGLCYVTIIGSLLMLLILTATESGLQYGRYQSRVWGFGVHPNLAWTIMVSPGLIVPLYLIVYTQCDQLWRPANTILLSAFVLHYIDRILYGALIQGGKPTPVAMFLSTIPYGVSNAYLQCRSLTQYVHYPSQWIWEPRFIIGMILFVCGLAINIHSDHILRSLRKPGETGYKIPTGGMFKYVSTANYLGELIEWTGYTVACWSLPALTFLIFSVSNVAPRAIAHHRWYLEKFKDTYPKDRKALIPFIL